ncbi:MAG TPA: permease, partial [Elusimicrobiales bacterium]|nr:permease [Elusimicrobiales bacterium]
MAGTALAAVVDTYFDSNKLLKKMGNGRTAVVLAVLLGALLPGCACAALPLAAALIKAGAGLGPVAAFLMAAPLLSPQTVVLTWAMLGPKFALARIFFALSGPILAGLLIQYFEKTGVTGFSLPPKQPPQNNTCSNDSNSCHCCAPRRTFFKSFIVLTGDLSKYFLLGMAIAVLFTWLVPTHAIKEHLGSGPLAYLLALIVGIPIYVCEGEEIPLTFALLSKGVSPGPAFTFMLGSVGTCIPTIAIAFSLL